MALPFACTFLAGSVEEVFSIPDIGSRVSDLRMLATPDGEAEPESEVLERIKEPPMRKIGLEGPPRNRLEFRCSCFL